MKEYERASTALADSYLKPVVSRQMGSMRNRLDAAGFKAPTVVMNSNGGEMTLSAAADAQVNLVVSARPAGHREPPLGSAHRLSFSMGCERRSAH